MIPKSPRRTKPYATLTSRKSMNKRGQSSRSKERASYQREMIETYGCGKPCAICSSTEHSFNAHRLKKRFIQTHEEYVHGRAPLCGECHRALDEATGEYPHERMFITISKLMDVEIDSPEAREMWERIERLGLLSEE